jgi:hypothetical protein
VRLADSSSLRATSVARRRATRTREAHIVTVDGGRPSLFAHTAAGSMRDRRRPSRHAKEYPHRISGVAPADA